MIKRIIAVLLIMVNVMTVGVKKEGSKRVTVSGFINMIEEQAGKLSSVPKIKAKKKLILEDAAVLLVAAGEQLYGLEVDEETVDYIIRERMAGPGKVSKNRKAYVAKAYALGLIAGDSAGRYSTARSFRGKKKIYEKEAREMIARLIDPGKRYGLSPDDQLLRIDKNSFPPVAELYPYILEDFPNEYYESMCHFMVQQVKVFEARESELWDLRGCTDYCGVMTWDTVFSKLTYEDRLASIRKHSAADRLGSYSAYLTPAEYDRGAADRNRLDGYMGMPLTPEKKRKMCDAAEEYVLHALNVDYRSIALDTEWQDYMLKNGIEQGSIERYIQKCVNDELILECDAAASDVSAVYYDRIPSVFSRCEGVVRVYAHYRIASDNGSDFPHDELTVNSGSGVQSLRNTRISDDGFKYIVDPCFDWQDGYFDIGVRNDLTVGAAIFDVMMYKAPFIEAFGYPCEAQSYYSGMLTVDGVLEYKRRNCTKEEYLEERGYLYCR